MLTLAQEVEGLINVKLRDFCTTVQRWRDEAEHESKTQPEHWRLQAAGRASAYKRVLSLLGHEDVRKKETP